MASVNTSLGRFNEPGQKQKFDRSRTHQGRIDWLFATNKTKRPQFITMQIDFNDRQDQKKNGGNESEKWRGGCARRAALRRPPISPERSE